MTVPLPSFCSRVSQPASASLFSLKNTLFFNPRAPASRFMAPPIFQLAAHTKNANMLAGKCFLGKGSQEDYNARIYATIIASNDRSTSVPIILSLEDSLSTLKAYAHDRFKISLSTIETTKMYVLWSTKVFYAVGTHEVPENLSLLDQDTLNTTLTLMKASPQVEQFLVQFEEDVPEAAAEEVNQAETRDNTPVPKKESSNPPDAENRGSPNGKEQSTSRKGKERERPSEINRNSRDSKEGYEHNPDLLVKESKGRVDRGKQQDMKQQLQTKKESRKPGSSSGASKGSSQGHFGEERRDSRRSGH